MMIKLGERSVLTLGLLLVLLASATMPASATSTVVASSATPAVTATLHDNWAGMDTVPPMFRYEFTQVPRYTLHVIGTNFVPGAVVKLALIDTSSLQVLHRGQTMVEPAVVFVHAVHAIVPNLRAGTFEYQAYVSSAPLAVSPHLWCRAASHMDLHEVTTE